MDFLSMLQIAMEHSSRDHVTELETRDAFEKRCNESADLGRYEYTVNGLMLIQIDRFDHYSLSRKEDLLRTAGDALMTMTGPDVFAARFIESTFVVGAHGFETIEELKSFCEKVFEAVHGALAGHGASCSMGTALCHHEKGGYRNAYDYANEALLEAKSLGGSRLMYFRYNGFAVSEGSGHAKRRMHDVTIRTFGYLQIMVDDRPVYFNSRKAKEYLAVLIDRRGAYVSQEEAISCLWENDPVNSTTMARLRKVAMRMMGTLRQYDADYIVESINGQRRLISSAVNCDLYRYLSGYPEYENLFTGYYMSDYSWAEMTLAELLRR